VSSFGAQLKQEREKQGVSLEDISLTTKIGTRMLRALEEEHFDQLPGGIFNKGFIRAYARCLGLDEEQAIADYLVATGATPAARKFDNTDQATDLSPLIEPPPREPSQSASLPWGTLAVVLLIVALGFAGWGFYSRESEKTDDSAPPPANAVSAQPVAAEPAPPESKPASDTPTRPVEQKAPAPQPAAAPAAVTMPTPNPDQPRTGVPANGSFQVLIRAHEDSWLSISVDGEIVTRSLLTAPAQKSVRAQNEIVVRAGNVGALDFEFNGTKLPSQGEHGEAKTLIFNSQGLQPSTPKPDPSTQPQ
jgi:cytoskeleton protein RodZ